ncbi:uncharacterized protein LOC129596392 [Paramacrobiotus metropolitanus]|uniref:uncharacterized protein LOC129596392 n=1 Tax=Paramacrobiotus metropolitanus TaxID=2943436 RepID=UPI002446275E|nr:uncharacterized protein LOC129596392 [Paramacrobiotus metropolitanus]
MAGIYTVLMVGVLAVVPVLYGQNQNLTASGLNNSTVVLPAPFIHGAGGKSLSTEEIVQRERDAIPNLASQPLPSAAGAAAALAGHNADASNTNTTSSSAGSSAAAASDASASQSQNATEATTAAATSAQSAA